MKSRIRENLVMDGDVLFPRPSPDKLGPEVVAILVTVQGEAGG